MQDTRKYTVFFTLLTADFSFPGHPSGGTFGPLQCSNLLQSATRNIYAVTSEWDCQVGKQLRSMYDEHESIADSSRLFTTGVGLAPAEPCSISVAATQQLLTNIFEHMCIVAISNPRYRHISGAVITERDLQILERLNRDNIQALEAIGESKARST